MEHSFNGALASLKEFYARTRDDPPPMVKHISHSLPNNLHDP